MTERRRFCQRRGHDTEATGRYSTGTCAECSRETARQWHVDNPGRIWARNLGRYGITADDYAAMMESQGGLCRVCRKPPSRTRLAVDHNHETGTIRGLLCQNCNRGLGLLGDDPALMRALADYVESAP